MRSDSARILAFSAVVCIVCATAVTSTAVLLADRQRENATLDIQRKVLEATGIKQRLDRREVARQFEAIVATTVELETGRRLDDVDPETVDPVRALADDALSRPAPPNPAQVRRLPHRIVVYEVRDEAKNLQLVILPIEGKGLWSTLRGFLSLDADLETIRGITFYSHGETPGLGGEVDNPKWKARWTGRRAFGPDGSVRIEVAKGPVGAPDEDPYRVDSISGATITSRGVSHLVRFWLGDHGFGPYLRQRAKERQ